MPLWRDGPIDRRRASIRQSELGITLAKLSADQQRLEARRVASLRYWEVEVATILAHGELRRFELGESNLLVVNLREQASAEAAIREIDALADFQRAVASFRFATARDLAR